MGFKYPMVFQGWQTLVGFLVFYIWRIFGSSHHITLIPSLDKAAALSLIPNFAFFTLSIVSGSKALSSIPVPYFLAVCNLIPVGFYIFDHALFSSSSLSEGSSSSTKTSHSNFVFLSTRHRPRQSVVSNGRNRGGLTKILYQRISLPLISCFIIFITSLSIVYIQTSTISISSENREEEEERYTNNDEVMNFQTLFQNTTKNVTTSKLEIHSSPPVVEGPWSSDYCWLMGHVIAQLLSTLHSRISDARFNSLDRQYYAYIFSLIVLAPASFYLDEAFAVLNYEKITQVTFISVSIVSAIVGVCLHISTFYLRNVRLSTSVLKDLKPIFTSPTTFTHHSTFSYPKPMPLLCVVIYKAPLVTSLLSILCFSSGDGESSIESTICISLAFINLSLTALVGVGVGSHLELEESKIEDNISMNTSFDTSQEGDTENNGMEDEISDDHIEKCALLKNSTDEEIKTTVSLEMTRECGGTSQ